MFRARLRASNITGLNQVNVARHYRPVLSNVTRRAQFDSAIHSPLRLYHSGNDWGATGKPSAKTSVSETTFPGLYYYLVGPPTPISASRPVYALSFLPTPPVKADSDVVIGWLPAQGGIGEVDFSKFRENPKFRDLLHRAIQEGLKEGVDEIQINGAIQLQHGWMHIHDERNVPPLGRIGDPNDIIASVLVENGEIQVDTYQPMPAYRICTRDGVTQLTPGLAEKMQSFLRQYSG